MQQIILLSQNNVINQLPGMLHVEQKHLCVTNTNYAAEQMQHITWLASRGWSSLINLQSLALSTDLFSGRMATAVLFTNSTKCNPSYLVIHTGTGMP